MPTKNSNLRLSLMLITLICITLIYSACLWDVIEGDPAIYLSYAKNFFKTPFAFGAPDRVSFGASSPLYLMILSAVYAAFGLDLLVPLKVVNYGLLACSIYLNVRTVGFILKNTDQPAVRFDLTRIYTYVMIGYVIFFNVVDNAVRLYETALVVTYVSILLYFYFREKFVILVTLSSLAYLVRPEIILLQFYFTSYSLYNLGLVQRRFALVISLLIISVIPAAAYHLYMYVMIGEVFPSSLVSRSIRNKESSILSWIYYLIRTNPQFLLVLFVSLMYAYLSTRRGGHQRQHPFNFRGSVQLTLLCFYGLALFAVLVLFSKSFSARYFEFLIPPLIVCFLGYFSLYGNIYNKRFEAIAFLSAMAVFLFKLCFPEYRNDSYLSNRLAPELSKNLNQIMLPNERLAVYEIQSQFWLEREAVSLDGRVGNEMLEFMKGHANLLSALLKNGVNYISVDDNVSPLISRDPFYSYLTKNTYPINEVSIYFDGVNTVSVKKVLVNSEPSNSLAMWRTIFEIRPIGGKY